jgi:Protein of unknown function (DUF3175)
MGFQNRKSGRFVSVCDTFLPPYQSAMSMLNFYINRAGANLSKKQKGVLVRAKSELRKAFHRE